MDDPDVNLVVVNTPDRYHVEYTMQALDHGKHVLCEKPFAMTAKEAKYGNFIWVSSSSN